MSRATDHLERIGAADRVEPSMQETIIALGMVLDERLGQIRDAINRQTRVLGERLLRRSDVESEADDEADS